MIMKEEANADLRDPDPITFTEMKSLVRKGVAWGLKMGREREEIGENEECGDKKMMQGLRRHAPLLLKCSVP